MSIRTARLYFYLSAAITAYSHSTFRIFARERLFSEYANVLQTLYEILYHYHGHWFIIIFFMILTEKGKSIRYVYENYYCLDAAGRKYLTINIITHTRHTCKHDQTLEKE